MAEAVLVLGSSGAGKSYGMKPFKPSEVGVLEIEKNRLPFKSDLKVARVPATFKAKDGQVITNYAQLNAAKYGWIQSAIKASTQKSIVIDDSQYLMANELFDRAKETGYNKFTDIALNFRNLIHFINDLDDENKIVYFLHHTEKDADGKLKAKTVGKMLDNVLTVEGCFNIVIYCDNHKFYTQTDGTNPAKTPEGMFDKVEIDNDLKAVDKAIREYYGMEANNA